jgi:hypothetical protein
MTHINELLFQGLIRLEKEAAEKMRSMCIMALENEYGENHRSIKTIGDVKYRHTGELE